MTDAAALLGPVRALALEAGAAILRIYADGFDPMRKADGSPVTAADHAAEAVILPGLRTLTPHIPIVSEEAFERGDIPEVGSGPFWLVDPLDGTKEFIRRNGEFTVNVALVAGGAPVLGVVLSPVTGELFAGAGPGTARLSTADGRERAIRVRPAPAEGLTVASSRSHANNRALDAYLAGLTVRERLVCGSSVKFCRIAEGRADLYPRFGPTMEWDTAAGQAVLLAAGGRVEAHDGSPFRYGKPGFRNPDGFVARGG
ncbi:MAG TPA: 3'(2'),5'-bisphosphate nucleotidase CysQ [Azospirillaceae bacterium]|nr:3'(2'),5'-bisphosphate nucleotidase CysQ [Azospirillaceae bacterium]